MKTRIYGPLLAAGLFLCLFAVGELTVRLFPYPELEHFQNRPYSTVVTDRNGTVLRVLPLQGGLRREYITLGSLRPELIRIFIESEDSRFFFHRGVDGFAVFRSLLFNRRAGRTVTGASTISMQLAGLIHPRERTFRGKLLEAWDAVRLEARLSKPEIFELWLNSLPFGRRAEGIGSGSRTYFNTPVSSLSVPECAVLAVIPRHPEKYNPLKNPLGAYTGALRNAARLTVHITADELQRAVANAEAGNFTFHAPHYIAQLEKRLVSGEQNSPAATITGSLDLEIQQYFHQLLYTYQQRYAQNRIGTAAGILLNNHSGEVLAYVGSLDYFSGRPGEQIDGLTVQRQPGSCLKPFLYAAALENGWLPNMLLPDVPLDFGGREIYVPMNFNNSFSGPVRLRVALGSSLNVPAVYLLDDIGPGPFAGLLRETGFQLARGDIEEAGLGAALGNLEVSLLELARGFALFPRRGRPVTLRWALPGESASGADTGKAGGNTAAAPGGDTAGAESASGPAAQERQAVSRYTADLICDILSDPAARAGGFGYNSAFTLPFPAMFKTGTSDQFQHIWALAATPDYTAGVWMGNNTGETVIGRTGSSVPARIAAEMLQFVQERNAAFPAPADSEAVEICTVSGQLATDLCPSVIIEYLPVKAYGNTVLPKPCSFHKLQNGTITTVYPEKYHAWLKGLDRIGQYSFSGEKTLSIIHPRDGAVFYYDPAVPSESQALRIEAVPGRDGACILQVNGEKSGRIPGPPYVWFLPLQRGFWELTVSNGLAEDTVKIEVR